MHSRLLVKFFLIFLFSATPAYAWQEEAWENFASPVTTEAKYPLMIGTGIVGGLFLFKEQIVEPVQQRVTTDQPLGENSKYGDLMGRGVPNAAYVLGMLGYGWMNPDSAAIQNAVSMFQASIYASLVTKGLKYGFREQRPDKTTHDSFPSGHATAAFSFASYVGCRHSLPWGIAAYSLASFVAYSRINDNRHTLSDVVGGATVGTSFGVGVCLAENNRNEKSKSATTHWQILPLPEGGARAHLSFAF
jgi:membrane-associated phospholipid phosphatase